ncbi:hypothetical protein ACTJJ4_07710 [Microbacterium sp. 22195]|uniref:hypothetical protein n=1 Tax=Microbacterium sp. 22195 TaxID=3453891 RepID=UPI003F87C94C
MMHVQLRRYLPDATTPAEVLDTIEIRHAGVASATAAITVRVSLAVADGIRQWIEDHPGQAFIVGLEYSVDSGPWQAPRNDLFVLYKGAADDTDPARVQQLTGMDWVSWQTARTYLHWSPAAVNNERSWTAISAGGLLATLVGESKGRGWAPGLSIDFTATADSAGVAWAAGDKADQTFRLLTPVSQILGALTEQGMCDWWSEGRKLRLFRPGTGTDHTEVVLGGADFTRAPGEWDFSGVFTNLTVVPEKAYTWLYLTNTGADTSFGRLEATMTQSDVADHATATRLAQPTLEGGKAAKREQSYEWVVRDGMPRPWVDFNIGDLVTIDTAFGPRVERVVELVVRVTDDQVVCSAVMGDKLLSAVARRDRRAQSAVIGSIIGGSGNGLPSAGGPTVSAPVAPTGLHVDSNTPSWQADGTALATIVLAWDAVTQSEDGSAVDVAGYEVAHRLASGTAIVESVSGISFTTTAWEPGITRYAKVRAVPRVGQPGAWSTEIAVTPATPASVVPKAPTGLAVVSNTAAFLADGRSIATVTLGWTPVTQSVDNQTVTIAEYEVLYGLETVRVRAASATVKIPTGATVSVTVRARTSIAVWGDPSTALPVTGAAPAGTLAAPTAPVLTSDVSTVVATWDGQLTSGAPGSSFDFVYTDVAPDVAGAPGTWRTLGQTLAGAGSASFPGVMDDVMWVRFRPVDKLGRIGAASASRSIVVVGTDGDNIVAGSIEVNHVSPSFGDSLNLQANGSINLLAGRADAAAEALNAQQSELDAQAVQLAAAQAAADAAASGASAAGIAAAAAAAQAAAAQAGVDNLSLAVQITPTDVRISRPGAPVALHLSNDQASFRRNGVAQTWWDETQMIVPKLKASQVIVGQTVITEGAGRTTWQRL